MGGEQKLHHEELWFQGQVWCMLSSWDVTGYKTAFNHLDDTKNRTERNETKFFLQHFGARTQDLSSCENIPGGKKTCWDVDLFPRTISSEWSWKWSFITILVCWNLSPRASSTICFPGLSSSPSPGDSSPCQPFRQSVLGPSLFPLLPSWFTLSPHCQPTSDITHTGCQPRREATLLQNRILSRHAHRNGWHLPLNGICEISLH